MVEKNGESNQRTAGSPNRFLPRGARGKQEHPAIECKNKGWRLEVVEGRMDAKVVGDLKWLKAGWMQTMVGGSKYLLRMYLGQENVEVHPHKDP